MPIPKKHPIFIPKLRVATITYEIVKQWPAVRTNLSEIKTEVHEEPPEFKNEPSMILFFLFLSFPQTGNRN